MDTAEREIEEEELLDEHVERVNCRWCNASGDAIEVLPAGDVVAEQ